MPLRDHFRPPLDNAHSWEELHGAWPSTIAYRLNDLLPPQYRSGVKIHLGSAVEIDVAINATPLGLAGHDPLPIDVNHIPGVSKALDLVYAPQETRWVHALRERGIEAQDGREMLVQQGAAAFARFFPGNDAPVEVMRAAVNRALRV